LRSLLLVAAAFCVVLAFFAARAAFGDWVRLRLAAYRTFVAESIEELGWKADPKRVVRLHVGASIAMVIVVALWIGWTPALLLGAMSGWASIALFRSAKAKRRALFEAQLPSTLDAISAALGQGLNLEHAITISAENADEPTKGELQLTMKEYRLGIQLDQSLTNASDRLQSRNLGMVAEAVGIAMQTGGNLSSMLQTTARAVQDIARLEEKMNVATAQGRMQTRLIVAMGPITLAAMALVAPEMVSPLFTDPLGWLMLATAVILDLIGVLLARKIQEADI